MEYLGIPTLTKSPAYSICEYHDIGGVDAVCCKPAPTDGAQPTSIDEIATKVCESRNFERLSVSV